MPGSVASSASYRPFSSLRNPAPPSLRPGDEYRQTYLILPGAPARVAVRIHVLWFWSRAIPAEDAGPVWSEFRVGLLRVRFCLYHPA